MTVLELDGIAVRLGRRPVLAGAALDAAPGEVVGLIGPNGAGKTTLLRAAAGLVPIAQGTRTLLGRPLDSWDAVERARTLAYLPQSARATWRIRVTDLVMLGRLPHRAGRWGGPDATDRDAVAAALEACDAAGLADRRVTELSGGETARVLLARVIATRPRVLLADEPTAGLDPAHALDGMALFRRLAADGIAVVVTLHDLGLAARFCDRLVLLDGGTTVADGPPATVLTPDRLATVYAVEAVRVEVEGRPLLVPVRRAAGPAATVTREPPAP